MLCFESGGLTVAFPFPLPLAESELFPAAPRGLLDAARSEVIPLPVLLPLPLILPGSLQNKKQTKENMDDRKR